MAERIKIGDLLLERGVITQTQLDAALDQQRKSGGKIGNVLVEMGAASVDAMLTILAQQLAIPYIKLKQFEFNNELVNQLPETYARRYRALVLQKEHETLLIGMADPQDIFAYSELSRILQQPIKVAAVEENALLRAIDMLYRQQAAISGFAAALAEELGQNDLSLGQVVADMQISEAPVAKLLHSLFEDAVQVHASDIHIEPDEDILRIRLRVDGMLQEQLVKNKSIAAALIQRLKLMANLDIAEKRLPQDGRFNIRVRQKKIDVRVATMPVQYGESMVMRLLDQSTAVQNLETLGMPALITARMRQLIARPHGMVLVTGPTGSGKTTTLYSILHELNKPEKKIITVEDPVEYRLARVNQIQVNSRIDLTFASILRTVLRLDPDIILVGEIRDKETAEIALRAAMTGHLVFATLHTNDARSSAMRLIDMGVDAYLVAVALRGVLAQRLMRCICEYCKAEHKLSPAETEWLINATGSSATTIFYQGTGCTHCYHTGYAGRVGVYELLELNEPMMSALRNNELNAFYDAVTQLPNARPLELVALDLAYSSKTTLEEVIRLAGEIEEMPNAKL